MNKRYAVFIILGLVSLNTLGQEISESEVDFAGFYGDEDFVVYCYRYCSADC